LEELDLIKEEAYIKLENEKMDRETLKEETIELRNKFNKSEKIMRKLPTVLEEPENIAKSTRNNILPMYLILNNDNFFTNYINICVLFFIFYLLFKVFAPRGASGGPRRGLSNKLSTLSCPPPCPLPGTGTLPWINKYLFIYPKKKKIAYIEIFV